MKDERDDFDREFWEPSQALTALLDLNKFSADTVRRMNESMLADIHGERQIAPPPSKLSSEALNFMYAIHNTYSSVGRFAVFEKMFQRYPWRGVISKSEHLQSTYYLFVHECYVLEERLKKLLSAAEAYAESKGMDVNLESDRRTILKLHRKVFGSLVRMRGAHVHQEEFIPREIKRISLLENTAVAYGISDPDARKIWVRYRNAVVSEVRKVWIEHCRNAAKWGEHIATLTFRATKSLWTELSKEAVGDDQSKASGVSAIK